MDIMFATERWKSFLLRNGIDETWYAKQIEASKLIPRYVRTHPRLVRDYATIEQQLDLLREAFFHGEKTKQEMMEHVDWMTIPREPRMTEFFALPQDVSLSRVDAYNEGLVYGIDVASGFVVNVLNPCPGEKVLDMCCAPGGKFCMIADLMGRDGLLVGVDASRKRLETTINILRKYGTCSKFEWQQGDERTWDCKVVLGDGVTFDPSNREGHEVLWDTADDEVFFCLDRTRSVSETEKQSDLEAQAKKRKRANSGKTKKRKRMNRHMRERIAKDRETRVFRAFPEQFDKVLVDAECTHDGSLRHMSK